MSNIVAHGQCGIKWTQVGNRTGHCSGCHLTFQGERAFDNHQTIKDGRVTCLDPTDQGLEYDYKVDKNTGTLVWFRPYDRFKKVAETPEPAVVSTTPVPPVRTIVRDSLEESNV